jgi:hypothetical protein
VYADPPEFRVGHKEPFYGGDRPDKGWDKAMRDAGIPEAIVGAVGMHFKLSAEKARGLAEAIYSDEDST